MDNADVLEDPVGRLRLIGENAQKSREDEERRQEIELELLVIGFGALKMPTPNFETAASWVGGWYIQNILCREQLMSGPWEREQH